MSAEEAAERSDLHTVSTNAEPQSTEKNVPPKMAYEFDNASADHGLLLNPECLGGFIAEFLKELKGSVVAASHC